ncbi:MAG: hypothetical protein KJ043_18890, partial [Anaerolineae bacterium]|nr:hypothetical protein [Anaerolineae bacterium]
NGHRILFSRLVTALLTITTQWDSRLEVVVNVLLACLNVWLTVRLIRQFAPSVVPLAWFPIALLLLSVDQMINWVSGVQSLWHFTLLCLLLSLNLLIGEKRRGLRLIGVLFWGIFATFSAGNGMVLWACIIGAMLILRYRWWMLTLTIVIAGLAIGAYLHNSGIGVGDGADVALYGQIQTPLAVRIAQTVLIFIGRPLADRIEIAPWIGLAGIIILYYGLLTRRKGAWLFGMVALYSLLSAGQVALTRVHHFDVMVAFSERYLSISLPFWMALCAIWLIRLSNMIQNSSPKIQSAPVRTRFYTSYLKLIPIIIIFAICTVHLFALSFQAGRTDWHNPVNHAMLEGQCIHRYPITREAICDNWIVPDPYLTDLLIQRRLSGFARSGLVD